VLDESFADMMIHMPEKVEPDYSSLIIAPMPGLVKSVNVKPGDMVRQLPSSAGYIPSLNAFR